MNTKITLVSLFDKNRTLLEKELQGLMLPDDADKVQNIISNYLNTLFESDGEFRQQLTLSEDYILQAALSLLNAQKSVNNEINKQKENRLSNNEKRKSKEKNNVYTPLIGTAMGAALGTLGGSWGTIFGSIAGTAIMLYSAASSTETQTSTDSTHAAQSLICVELFLETLKNVCEKIDELIEVFRTQIKRVEHVYEQKEKPTLQSDYSLLLQSIEELVNVANTECEDSEKKLKRLEKKANNLAECLENYGIVFVDGKIIENR